MTDLKDQSGPVRTCLGCRARKEQARLRRLALVREPKGARVIWDEKRNRGGRGAWLCADQTGCLGKALRKNILVRAFRLNGEVDVSGLTRDGNGAESPDGLATSGFLR